MFEGPPDPIHPSLDNVIGELEVLQTLSELGKFLIPLLLQLLIRFSVTLAASVAFGEKHWTVSFSLVPDMAASDLFASEGLFLHLYLWRSR